ncbi:MAG: hypothetical protein WCS73_10930 [Lentisphaeria bacterium]
MNIDIMYGNIFHHSVIHNFQRKCCNARYGWNKKRCIGTRLNLAILNRNMVKSAMLPVPRLIAFE